eukprot:TRINITY_DN4619_c0_g1_i1.p1 TRINITY_DN4619_c0_g1~~TRINITY_DN4619_c0_g1_i1.p1  ORF type:complete len:422 (-),score=140.93 TRINITY_DN4619_c0_g1_i1:47-1312(-)
MGKNIDVKYEPLSLNDEGNAPQSPPSSQLRFSQTHSPKYTASKSYHSDGYVTPFQDFNSETFHDEHDGILAPKPRLWRHSRRSRVILCLLGMGCISLLSFLIVTGIGLGLDYQCKHPTFQKSRVFNSPFESVKNLNINGVNTFVEFETDDDDDVTDIVVTVKTGARKESDFKLMTVNSTKSDGTFAINIGGDPNLDLDAFMDKCLLTSVVVVFPPKKYFNGNINVNIKSGEIELKKISGWNNANLTVARGRIEVKEIQSTSSSIKMSVNKGQIEAKKFQAKSMDIQVVSVETKLSEFTIQDLKLKVDGESSISMKSVTLLSKDSNLRIEGDGQKSSLKLSGLNQGHTNINLPNGKVSVGVSSSFCGPFDLNAGDFEFNGGGIKVDASSTSTKKTGTVGSCESTTSWLTSVSKGKLKLTVKD